MFSKIGGDGRQLVYCSRDINHGDLVFLDISDKKTVSLFGGYYHLAAISDKGEVIFINSFADKESPNSDFQEFQNWVDTKLSQCQVQKTTAWQSARKAASLNLDQINMADSALAKKQNQFLHSQ